MKCDTCKHSVLSYEIYGWEPFCNKEHWGGGPIPGPSDDRTVWNKCKDFKYKEKKNESKTYIDQ